MNTNHKIIEVDGYFMVQMNDGSFCKSYSTDEIRTSKDSYYAARIASRKFAEEMVVFLVRFFDENGKVKPEPVEQEEASREVASQSSVWKKEEIEMTVRNTFKAEFKRTEDTFEASNKTIDEVFAKYGNLSEQELNIVRNCLARKIEQYTKKL